MYFYKKKSLYNLKRFYGYVWVNYYINFIISYDFLYKFQDLNISKLLLLCKSPSFLISFDVSKTGLQLAKIADTFDVFKRLTNQKFFIISTTEYLKNNKKASKLVKYHCELNLVRHNFNKFFNNFVCYIYPTILKRDAFNLVHFLNSSNSLFKFNEFHLYLHSKYDFLEYQNLNLNFTLNLLNKDTTFFLITYFLNYFNIKFIK